MEWCFFESPLHKLPFKKKIFCRCTDAYYEYIYNQRFYDCSTFLTEFYYLEDAIEFCDDDCINYLNHADSVIAQACGFPFDVSILLECGTMIHIWITSSVHKIEWFSNFSAL